MRRAHVAAAVALFACTLWFRVAGISSTFMLLADQIRDWTFALLPATDLPLTGPPSLAGGRAFGPVYYWVLWLSRVTIGPFVDNLPHAGGIGLSILQSAADAALCVALARRFGGVALAAATVLLVATSPFEAAVTASIWNPQVAVALAKFAIALVLLAPPEVPWRRQLVIAAVAWMATQAHASGIIVTLPVLAWLVLRPAAQRQWAGVARAAALVAAVVLVLQIPFALHYAIYGTSRSVAPTRAAGALAALPEAGLRGFADSAATLVRYGAAPLIEPGRVPGLGWLLIVAAVVAVARVRRHGSRWLVVTVAPIATAIVIWAPFRDRSDYWYLAVTPSVALLAALTLGTWPRAWTWRRWAGWVALAAVLVAVPARFEHSRKLGRLPEYGTLVAGARQIARSGLTVHAVGTWKPVPGTDPEFLVQVLGGRVERGAAAQAIILADGRVRYERVPGR